MTFDRYCIIKRMALDLLADYGHEAYEAFCKNNPNARNKQYEMARAINNEKLRREEQERIDALIGRECFIPHLVGPWGRVMP